MRELGALTLSMFAPLLGSPFGMPDRGFESQLVEVNDLGRPGAGGLRAPFSLVFRGPFEPFLEQGIHRLEHEELGRLDLFLVPIGPDEAGMRYEAVFG
jgi:hypothetical protein